MNRRNYGPKKGQSFKSGGAGRRRAAIAAASTAALLMFSAAANASLIASDNFDVGGTGASGSAYETGSLGTPQSATTGTTGYASGSAWIAATSILSATTSTLSSPLLTPNGQASTPQGASEVGTTTSHRWQYRQLASFTAPTTYYFSELLEASNPSNITGSDLGVAGLSTYQTSYTAVFGGGVQIGYAPNGLEMYYYTGSSGTTQNTLDLLTSTADSLGYTLSSDTYLAEMSIDPVGGVIDVSIYDGSTEVATASVTASTASLGTTQLGSFAAEGEDAPGVYFTDLRFGTAQSDVINLSPVPEPMCCMLIILAALPLLRRRRDA